MENMRNMKKALALLLGLALLLLAGCGASKPEDDTDISDIIIGGAQSETEPQSSDAGTAGGQTIPLATDGNVSYSPTLYLLMMEEAFQSIQLSYDLKYDQVLSAAVKLDDGSVATGSDYVRESADTSFHWHYTVERLCREAGLEIADSSYYNQALYYASQSYASAAEYYDFFNISSADLLAYFMYQYRYNDLFFHTYGKGGDKEIGEGELEKLMSGGAYRIEYVYLPFTDSQSGQPLADSEIAARKAMIGDYESRFRAGEDFEDIIYESYKYLSPTVTRSESTDYNYYIPRSGDSANQEIRDAAAELGEGEMKAIETESYCALVLRLPVNQIHSDKWRSAALQLAYTDKYGKDFADYMVGQYEAIVPNYNQAIHELLSPEAYVELLDEYFAGE